MINAYLKCFSHSCLGEAAQGPPGRRGPPGQPGKLVPTLQTERQIVSIRNDLGSDTAKKTNGFLILNSVTMLLSSQVLVYLDLQDRKENLAALCLPQVRDGPSHFRLIIARPKNQHDIINHYCLSLEHLMHSFLFCLRNIFCWTTRTSRTPGPPGSSW